MANELLSSAYDSVKPEKAKRLRECATRLTFEQLDNGKLRLRGMFNCRVRLCPVCTWRRSLKVAAQMHAIMNAIKADKPCSYILVTFTQKNCEPEDLQNEITLILRAFNNLTKLKAYQRAIHGYYRAMEVTHNISGDTYHPHIHAVFAVNRSYFTNKNYISQDQWVALWRQCLDLDYDPNVDVRRIKGDTARAVAEVAKYSVKTSDYLIPDDWEMTLNTVRLLDIALDNRRFVGFGGIFKEYHKKLHLDDAESGDLVNVDPDDKLEVNKSRLVHFAWYSGYRQYVRD